jgi:hypothetical protein
LTYVKIKSNIRENYSLAKASYAKPTTLLNLIERYLVNKEWREELDRCVIAGGMTEEHAEKHREEFKHEKNNIDVAKVRILNKHIFPEMANLTVLLEKMQIDPYIREVFKDDIENLFFARSTDIEDKTHIFYRFLSACVAKPKRSRRVDSNEQTRNKDATPRTDLELPLDSRFILAEYMQRAVYAMVSGIEPQELGGLTFLQNKLLSDIENATQWLTLLAQRAHDHLEIDEDRRPALF